MGRRSESRRHFALAVLIIAVCTLIALVLRPHVDATNLVMVYLCGVVLTAMRCSRGISVLASFLSVAAFDFFCVPPYLTFRVHDYEYLITFAGMLMVALVISAQTGRIRMQAADAGWREARTETLYNLSRRLAGQTRVFEIARTAAEYVEEVFPARIGIFLPENGQITFQRRTCEQWPIARSEENAAQRAFDRGEKAGRGMEPAAGGASFYIPLRGAKDMVGVMGVIPKDGAAPFSSSQLQLLEVLANQAALGIERAFSQHAAEAARVQMHTEEMRSSLLSAVSHDLRTPLSSITGAASTLRSQGDRLQPEVRQELLDSIAEEAERLGRLVSNLLDMTRLESGVELRRDLYPLEEIVGSALQRMERQLANRQVTTDLPEDLPLVSIDDVLLGQLVVNLLENAIKYTPEGTPIELAAEAVEGSVILEVRDRGPGFAPGDERRIFEKFYRGKSEGVRGAGVGLAICLAIMQAHRGTIEAFNRPGGGAVFRIRLPLETHR
jgi:two-component system, OmpR family, sensor histidine kinase KdpD